MCRKMGVLSDWGRSMVLFIDTSANQQGKTIVERASRKNSGEKCEYIATADMNMAGWVG